jgi:hypothetical protein
MIQLLTNHDDYLGGRYGSGLGWVSSIEVASLGPRATKELLSHFPDTPRHRRWPWSDEEYFVHKQRTVRGLEALRLAAHWRNLSFGGDGALCHEPGFVLRFYLGPWKRAELTTCWKCSNLAVPAVFWESYLEFDALSTNGLALLEELKRIAPLPVPTDFNYTNALLSQSDLEFRVFDLLRDPRNRETQEWIRHSPQKAHFLDVVTARLTATNPFALKSAIYLASAFELTNTAPRLHVLLGAPNPETALEALSALQRLKVPVPPNALFPLLCSADASLRDKSLRILADQADVEVAKLVEHLDRSLALYGKVAYYPSTTDKFRGLTNRHPQWAQVVVRLQQSTRSNAPAMSSPTLRSP